MFRFIKRVIDNYNKAKRWEKNGILSDFFGYEIYEDQNGTLRYFDNKQVIENNPRKCPKCNLYATEKGHDPCIKNLPGVKYACCGHGGVSKPYVKLDNGKCMSLNRYYKLYNQ